MSKKLGSVVLAIMVLVGLAACTDMGTEVSGYYVSVDINPSIEITLNDDDEVINISAINNDGELLIDRDINFKGLSLDRTIEIIIAEAIKRGFIVDDTDFQSAPLQSCFSSVRLRFE